MGNYTVFPLQCFLELLGTVLLSHTADSLLSSADPVVHFLSVPVTAPAPLVHQDHLSLGRLCFLQGQLQPEHLWTGGDLSGVCCSRCVCTCTTQQWCKKGMCYKQGQGRLFSIGVIMTCGNTCCSLGKQEKNGHCFVKDLVIFFLYALFCAQSKFLPAHLCALTRFLLRASELACECTTTL